ncbi:MAG: hypothetical protein LBL21_00785 [Rickettsiales bacterium]|nr:hypothetical protein [Rickettsiales bacterium]
MGDIGNPTAGGGQYCWCRIVVNSIFAAWVFGNDSVSDHGCRSECAHKCSTHVYSDRYFRLVICTPSNICDDTAVVAEDDCPAGYAKCVGSKAGSDIAGEYTINCSE